MLLFVYGTLRYGCTNHYMIEGVPYVGETVLKDHAMVNLGFYPAAIPMKGQHIVGDVYEVSDDLLRELDELEGYNPKDESGSHYIRRKVKTNFGEVWVYIYNDEVDTEDGIITDWCEAV